MEENRSSDEPRGEPHRRLGFKAFAGQFLSELVNIDRGVPGTFLALFRRPEEVVRDYFDGHDRYMNPFRYVVVIVTIVTLILSAVVDFEEFYLRMVEAGIGMGHQESLEAMPEGMSIYFEELFRVGWLMTSKYMPVTFILLLSPALAVTSYLFFKNRKSYFSQHFIMNMYLSAQASSFGLITIPIIMQLENMMNAAYVTLPLTLAYLVWFYKRNFALQGFGQYAQAVVSYILGYVVYLVFLMIAQNLVTALLVFVV
ncbi:MAG: DUF3667 domain-containing protein [Balneolaceae bacterium]|nr:DUF3667 domain-containing protein [Balneolaceae bacterium]